LFRCFPAARETQRPSTLGHGEVGKTWEKVAKELQVLGVKHSVAVLHKKLSHLMMWHEVSNLLFFDIFFN
jgi:hypothetical protein